MSAGTLTLTNNSASVAGQGTTFSTELAGGDFILVTVGGIPYTLPVKSVDSNTALTLVCNFTGPTQAGAAWSAIPRVALNMVTAALVAQSAEALRGLNYDKQNWQQFFTADGDVTITLPDNSQSTGPSAKKLVNLVSNKADKVNGAVPIDQGGTGAKTASEARGSLGLKGAAVLDVGTTAGTVAAGDDSRLTGALQKTGGTATGNFDFTGFTTLNSTSTVRFKGFRDASKPEGANSNDLVISTPTNAGAGAYACQIVYQWYSDGWLTGIKRNAGYGTNSYSIYFNGASTGAGREWNFNIDGNASGGQWINGSDIRHKSKLVTVEHPLSAVLSFHGVSYDVKDGDRTVGLIAQDVEQWCPEAIKTYGDREFSDGEVIKDFKYLDTTGVSAAYHTEAIKELFSLVELALDDPTACRKRIAEIKSLVKQDNPVAGTMPSQPGS
ncbi:tail fiber domain-containing protein [Yokenella regensburgei]|uniref:tail fiber domain-containing protein n=1 Tax=Yokenella regensburgei TaxID=158877 RepID=UPI0028983270|nr:tail fiber domain-containing protein [Yokenella regensburgei]